MESHLQSLIGYFSAHPQLALAAVFAAAMLESLVVIGTIVPGSSRLMPNTPIEALAVLPKLDHGQPQGMTSMKVLNADERIVLRLWPSPYVVGDNDGAGATRPLWIGMVSTERLRHPAGLVTLAATGRDFMTPLRQLARDLHDQQGFAQWRERAGRAVLLLW